MYALSTIPCSDVRRETVSALLTFDASLGDRLNAGDKTALADRRVVRAELNRRHESTMAAQAAVSGLL